jgi:hypothetical protein
MLQTKVVGNIKRNMSCLITFFQKSCHLWDNMEKDGRTRQATDNSLIQYLNCVCWMTMVTHALSLSLSVRVSLSLSEYVTLLAFPQQQWICEHTWMLCLYVCCVSCFFSPLPVFFLFGVVGLVYGGGDLNFQQQVCEYVVILWLWIEC